MPSAITSLAQVKRHVHHDARNVQATFKGEKRLLDGPVLHWLRRKDRYPLPSLGSIPLKKLTPRHVKGMESNLLRGGGADGGPLSPRTVVQAHRVPSKALNDGVNDDFVRRNAEEAVEPPRTTKYEAKTLGWDEVHAFLGQINNPLHLTLVLLDIQTGLRRSELLGLQWRDIDLSEGTLSLQRALIRLPSGGTELTVPKTGRGRLVELPQESIDALRSHRERNQSTSGSGNFVFCHSDGSPLDPDLVSKWFRKIANNAGMEGLRLRNRPVPRLRVF